MMKKATSNLSAKSSGARRMPHTSLHWGAYMGAYLLKKI
jgi:hypothetical protein